MIKHEGSPRSVLGLTLRVALAAVDIVEESSVEGTIEVILVVVEVKE